MPLDPHVSRALGKPVACLLCGAPFAYNQEWVAYEMEDGGTAVMCPDCLSAAPARWTTLAISLENGDGGLN